MGTYKRNAEHSPTNLANVYTKTDDSDTHFYRSNRGYWYVSKTDADMVVGKSGGWIMSPHLRTRRSTSSGNLSRAAAPKSTLSSRSQGCDTNSMLSLHRECPHLALAARSRVEVCRERQLETRPVPQGQRLLSR